MTAQEQIARAEKWLKDHVLPLWSTQGVDSKSGAFQENLDFSLQPTDSPRRAMVQSRQINMSLLVCLGDAAHWEIELYWGFCNAKNVR